MKIKFIAQYVSADKTDKRNFSPGGVSKMNYLLLVLNELGHQVEILSTSSKRSSGFTGTSRSVNNLGQSVKYRSSFSSKSHKIKFLDILWGQLTVASALMTAKRSDLIFLYHERYYTPVLKTIAGIRNLKVILDIEEVYTMASGIDNKAVKRELNSFDFRPRTTKYLLATESLNRYLPSGSEYAVCSGVYAPLIQHKTESKGKKQVVYAGTFDKQKGGACIAVQCAKYLDGDSFELNICGFGNKDEIAHIEEMIDANNRTPGNCKINYHGKLIGKDYTDLIERCDIGLACQKPDKQLSETAFPSKIFEYLRNGLSVVSSDVSSVRKSPCAPVLSFFEDYTPKGLAMAILQSAKDSDAKAQSSLMHQLHDQFRSKLENLING